LPLFIVVYVGFVSTAAAAPAQRTSVSAVRRTDQRFEHDE
jgi:hypothetical protein